MLSGHMDGRRYHDIWSEDNDRIKSRTTHFIAHKSHTCKEVKADSFQNKECFILTPVNDTGFYGYTGMEAVETVINDVVLNERTQSQTGSHTFRTAV